MEGKTSYKPLYRKVSRPIPDKDSSGELPHAKEPDGRRDFRESSSVVSHCEGHTALLTVCMQTVSGCVPEIRFWDLGDCVRVVACSVSPNIPDKKSLCQAFFAVTPINAGYEVPDGRKASLNAPRRPRTATGAVPVAVRLHAAPVAQNLHVLLMSGRPGECWFPR